MCVHSIDIEDKDIQDNPCNQFLKVVLVAKDQNTDFENCNPAWKAVFSGGLKEPERIEDRNYRAIRDFFFQGYIIQIIFQVIVSNYTNQNEHLSSYTH